MFEDLSMWSADFGGIPEPTVKVRMVENKWVGQFTALRALFALGPDSVN
jgi:hypothetical protein